MKRAVGNVRVVGKCGVCGGRVTVPTIWWGVVPPTPTCESCGALVDDTAFLPVLPMKPSRRVARTGGQAPHQGWKLRSQGNATDPHR